VTTYRKNKKKNRPEIPIGGGGERFDHCRVWVKKSLGQILVKSYLYARGYIFGPITGHET